MNSVALAQQAQSAGAFVRNGFAASSERAEFGAGPLSISTTIVRGLVRLSLLIVVLLGLITFGCGLPV